MILFYSSSRGLQRPCWEDAPELPYIPPSKVSGAHLENSPRSVVVLWLSLTFSLTFMSPVPEVRQGKGRGGGWGGGGGGWLRIGGHDCWKLGIYRILGGNLDR